MAEGRIFESATYALDAEMRSMTDTAVLFFPHRWATRRAMHDRYGASFAAKYGLNAVMVRAKRPDWFQSDDFEDLAQAIAEVSTCFDRVILTGSSMGGYGAIRVAEHVPVDHVIAFSPISNIDPDVYPYEKGFVADFDPARPFHVPRAHSAKRYSVFFDPTHRDRLHNGNFALPEDRSDPYAVVGAGHQTATLLAESGTLSRITLALIDGQPIGGLLSETRRAKRETPSYLLALFRRSVKRRPEIAARALTEMILRGYHEKRLHRLVRQLPPDLARAAIDRAAA